MRGFLNRLSSIQNKVLGLNERNTTLVYAHNDRRDYPLADDKSKCKEILHKEGIATPETFVLIDGLRQIPNFWENTADRQKLVIKPAKGSGGGGILVLNRLSADTFQTPSGKIYDKDDIEMHLANIIFGVYSFGSSDIAIVEQQLIPHSFFTNIYSNGIPDFRVIVFKNQPLMAMLRMPTNASDGKGNLHAGAIGVGIDLESGVLTKGFMKGEYLSAHPDSQVVFEGLQLPCWEETMALTLQTAKAFPLKYLGIDIVFDEVHGPMIMEINVRPGLEIQNVNQKGLLERINELKIN